MIIIYIFVCLFFKGYTNQMSLHVSCTFEANVRNHVSAKNTVFFFFYPVIFPLRTEGVFKTAPCWTCSAPLP